MGRVVRRRRKKKNIAPLIILILIIGVLLIKFVMGYMSAALDEGAVVIDAGHGGYDPGAIGAKEIYEKDMNLSVALKLGELLEDKGFVVYYTRESDIVKWPSNVNEDLRTRTKIANGKKAGTFISIHVNSNSNKNINGIETYYNTMSNSSKVLAKAVQDEIVKASKLADRGIRSENYYVLKHVKGKAILVELGYISNEKEANIISQEKMHVKFAEAISKALGEPPQKK